MFRMFIHNIPYPASLINMPAISSTYWCFTLNFDGDTPDLFGVFEATAVRYACWQHERVSHDHLQGYIQLSDRKTLNQVKEIFKPHNPHLEKQRARKNTDARDYCLKPESRIDGPWEFGEFLVAGSNKGRQREQVCRSPERMAEENPSVFRRVKARMSLEAHMSGMPCLPDNLKPWQVLLEKLLIESPHDRNIIWVYGPKGGEGKSTFAKDLLRRGWFYTRGGTQDNVSYQYIDDVDRHIVFDIPRDKKDYLQYSLIEMLKDGIIISNKYEPVTAVSSKPRHCVVMCNFLPDFEKISVDRVIVLSCIKATVVRDDEIEHII